MAVPSKWKLVIENKTGVTINAFVLSPFDGVEARLSGTIIGPTDNAINPQAEITVNNAAAILNNTFGDLTPEHDNATDKYWQVDGSIRVAAAGVPAGDVVIYLNIAPTGTTNYADSDDKLIWLATMNFTAAGTQTRAIRFW